MDSVSVFIIVLILSTALFCSAGAVRGRSSVCAALLCNLAVISWIAFFFSAQHFFDETDTTDIHFVWGLGGVCLVLLLIFDVVFFLDWRRARRYIEDDDPHMHASLFVSSRFNNDSTL